MVWFTTAFTATPNVAQVQNTSAGAAGSFDDLSVQYTNGGDVGTIVIMSISNAKWGINGQNVTCLTGTSSCFTGEFSFMVQEVPIPAAGLLFFPVYWESLD